MATAYCPHCALDLAADVELPYPQQTAVRCRHCRLVVGPGRAKASPEGAAGGRGAAAGRYASEARRAAKGGEAGDPDAVLAAVRIVAEAVGRRPHEVRMLEYRELAEQRGDLPPLADVIATFGSWKSAIARAGQEAQE
jgi:hypothetical protein